MGRFLMYATLVVLAVFVLSSYLVLEHGGGTIAQVQEVSVHDLTLSPSRYDGQPVTIKDGTLQRNDVLGRWELAEESANFAIEVRNYEDQSELQLLGGRRVKVHGIFGVADDGGVYVNADTIHAAGD